LARGWEGVGHRKQQRDELVPEHAHATQRCVWQLAQARSDPLFFFNEGSSAGGGSAARRAGGGDLFRKRDDWKGKLVKQACKKARHNDGLPVSLSVCCLPPSASIYPSRPLLAVD